MSTRPTLSYLSFHDLNVPSTLFYTNEDGPELLSRVSFSSGHCLPSFHSVGQCLASPQCKAMPPFPILEGKVSFPFGGEQCHSSQDNASLPVSWGQYNAFFLLSGGQCIPSCHLRAMPFIPSVEDNDSLPLSGEQYNAFFLLSGGQCIPSCHLRAMPFIPSMEDNDSLPLSGEQYNAFFLLSGGQCIPSCHLRAMPFIPSVEDNASFPLSGGQWLPFPQCRTMPPFLSVGGAMPPFLSVEGNASLPVSWWQCLPSCQ